MDSGTGLSNKLSPLNKRFKKTRPGNATEAGLAEEYLPLVRTIAARVAMTLPPHVDIEDINSSGRVGLLNAIRKYNPQGGSTFESYAKVRIRGAIFDELRRLDWIPRSVHELTRKVQAASTKLEQSLGRAPAVKEVAEELNMSLEEYDELMTEIKPPTFICLDSSPCSDEEGETSNHESITDDSQRNPLTLVMRRELAEILMTYIEDLLPEMHRKVLALYYFQDLRLRDIAEIFDVTESRICQLHVQGVNFLRERMKELEESEIGMDK